MSSAKIQDTGAGCPGAQTGGRAREASTLYGEVRSSAVDGVGTARERAAVARAVDGARVPARRRSRRSKFARITLQVLVLAGAALFVLDRVGNGNLGEVSANFDRLHWHWLFVSVAAEGGSIVMLSWLQQRLLRAGDLAVGVRDLLPVTMASNAVAQSLPGGTLFAEGYAFRQYQRLGASKALGVWAELSAGALASAALAAVAVVGSVVVGPGLRVKLLPILAVVLAGALVAAALFRRAPRLGLLIGGVLRLAERALPERLCRPLRSAQDATKQMSSFQPSVATWFLCFAAAALNWGLDAVVLIMGLLTVGAARPLAGGVLLCYAAAQLLVELPVTPRRPRPGGGRPG